MLTITISAPAHSGKTAIAQLIEDALRSRGFKAVVNTDSDRIHDGAPRPTEFNDKCLESLSNREDAVVIETIQTQKSPSRR